METQSVEMSGDLSLIGAAAGATRGNAHPVHRQPQQPQTQQRASQQQRWRDDERHRGWAPEAGAGDAVSPPRGDAVPPPQNDAVSSEGSAGAGGEAVQETPVRWGSGPWGRATNSRSSHFGSPWTWQGGSWDWRHSSCGGSVASDEKYWRQDSKTESKSTMVTAEGNSYPSSMARTTVLMCGELEFGYRQRG